jgi:hypothetical protein
MVDVRAVWFGDERTLLALVILESLEAGKGSATGN